MPWTFLEHVRQTESLCCHYIFEFFGMHRFRCVVTLFVDRIMDPVIQSLDLMLAYRVIDSTLESCEMLF